MLEFLDRRWIASSGFAVFEEPVLRICQEQIPAAAPQSAAAAGNHSSLQCATSHGGTSFDSVETSFKHHLRYW
jgi:hypothetical protein